MSRHCIYLHSQGFESFSWGVLDGGHVNFIWVSFPLSPSLFQYLLSCLEEIYIGGFANHVHLFPLDLQVLLLMRNLTMNLSSPDFEPIVSVLLHYVLNSYFLCWIYCFL